MAAAAVAATWCGSCQLLLTRIQRSVGGVFFGSANNISSHSGFLLRRRCQIAAPQSYASASDDSFSDLAASAAAPSAAASRKHDDSSPLGPAPEGFRSGYVALVGRPNAGKSTLLNRVVGLRLSAVTPKVQTTRERVLGLVSDEMYQIILLDTPGIINRTNSKLEEYMMAAVRQALRDADVVLALVEADGRREDLTIRKIDANSEIFQDEEEEHEETGKKTAVQEGASSPQEQQGNEAPSLFSKGQLVVVVNKADKVNKNVLEGVLEYYEAIPDVDLVIPISALTGKGVDDLMAAVRSRLPLGPRYFPEDIVAEAPERFFVADIIRGKVMQQYNMEIPYATNVHVVDFHERPPEDSRKDYIKVRITVEKESQKGIIIGRKGTALKKLLTESRQEIETFLMRPVYLEAEVAVEKNWRKKDKFLKNHSFFY